MDLNQITLPSTDLTRSIAFYQSLGFRLIVHTHAAYARFECPTGHATFSLHLVESLPKAGGIQVYFECERLDQKVAELQAEDIQFQQLPLDQPWLWREARLLDPDNNQLILYYAGENRKNPPWRIT